jgi:hypothetical protein
MWTRWWLVDPDGHPFFSTGPCVVDPLVETHTRLLTDALTWLPDRDGEFADCFDDRHGFDYLKANLIRAFGADWRAGGTAGVPGAA